MADILIRKLSDDAKERLAAMAAKTGSSLEAFLRQMLEEKAVEAPRPNDEELPFSILARQLFGDGSGERLADILDNLEYAPEPEIAFGRD